MRQYPEIETGVITVTTSYPGASASSVWVMLPSRCRLKSPKLCIDYMTSDSALGNGHYSVLETGLPIRRRADRDFISGAASEIQAISGVLIRAFLTTSQSPILYVFSSDTPKTEQVSDYVSRVVKPTFLNRRGVSKVDMLVNKISRCVSG